MRMLAAHSASLCAKGGNVMNKLRVLRTTTAAILCFVFASVSWPHQAGANAAGVKLLASVALTSVLDKLHPAFAQSSGSKLSVTYGSTADIKRRVLDGESVDVVIIGSSALDDLQKQGKLMPGSVTPVPRYPSQSERGPRSQISVRSMHSGGRSWPPSQLSTLIL